MTELHDKLVRGQRLTVSLSNSVRLRELVMTLMTRRAERSRPRDFQ
jgi:hypothetical protein